MSKSEIDVLRDENEYLRWCNSKLKSIIEDDAAVISLLEQRVKELKELVEFLTT